MSVIILSQTRLQSNRVGMSSVITIERIEENEADFRPPAGRLPSGFLTRYCYVSFHPINLAFVPFDRTASKLQVNKFSKFSL